MVSRPPVSKYDLNSDITDAQLSKLEPEKELNIGDRDFALTEAIGSHETAKRSHEEAHKSHSEPDNAENEIEDVDYDVGDYDNNDYQDTNDDKNNDLQAVLTSFLMFIPKNSTMADLFNTVAKLLDDPSSNSTDCSQGTSTR